MNSRHIEKKLVVALLALLAPTLLPAAPNVSIEKSVSPPTAMVTDTVRYYISIENLGDPGLNTTITDVLPPDVTFLSCSDSCKNGGGTLTWDIGTIDCNTVTVTQTIRGSYGGNWPDWEKMQTDDDDWALSSLSGGDSQHTRWLYFEPIIGSVVTTVTSVKVFTNSHFTGNLLIEFSADGDQDNKEGSTPLSLGLGSGVDVWETWDITGSFAWDGDALSMLAIYLQHDKVGGGSNVYMDDVFVEAVFEECGKVVYYDVIIADTAAAGQVIPNTAEVAGSNYGTVTSSNAPLTVKGPDLRCDKSAQPTIVRPGDTVRYLVTYENLMQGLNFYDDFEGNWGGDSRAIPNWTCPDGKPDPWINEDGLLKTTGGYYRMYRDDTGPICGGAISSDVFFDSTGDDSNLMFSFDVGGTNNFYKSKLYYDVACGGWAIDMQRSGIWDQPCGNKCVPEVPLGAWFRFEVRLIAPDHFKAYIDGVEVFECNDPNDWITVCGYAGIFGDGSAVEFDNFRIGDDMPAKNVVITDPLDSEVTFVSASHGGYLNGSTVTWDLGTVEGGQMGTLTYWAVVDSGASEGTIIPDIATSDADNDDPWDSTNAAVTVVSPALDKSASPTQVDAGDTVTYTIVATGTGGGWSVSDDHNDGAFVGVWKSRRNIFNTWQETLASGYITLVSNASDELTHQGSYGRDGTLTVDVYLKEGDNDNGVLLGYDETTDDCYVINFFLGWNQNDDDIRLLYWDGSGYTVLDSYSAQYGGNTVVDPTDGSGNVWATVKVIRSGSRFDVYVDGVYFVTLVDSANNITVPGYQGYFAHGGDWRFDNFSWSEGSNLVTIVDTIPTNMNFVSSSHAYTIQNGLITWDLGELPPGGGATVTWVAEVDVAAPAGVEHNWATWLVPGDTDYTSPDAPVTIGVSVPTNTNTPTPTITDSATYTPTYTNSPTPTVTNTDTRLPTPTDTQTDSPTATATRTFTPSVTFTPSYTDSPTMSVTETDTRLPTVTWTSTDTPTSTNTETFTPSVTFTPSYTDSPTMSVTETSTRLPTYTTTNTDTSTRTATETFTPSVTFTASVTDTPTFTVTETYTPSVTFTASDTHTPTDTVTETKTRLPTATYTWTDTPSNTHTLTYSASVTYTATRTITITGTRPYTRTATVTFTPSRTITITGTRPYTRTATPTKTLLPTATQTWTNSPTRSSTPSNTVPYTFSSTPTITPTATRTATRTPTLTDVPGATNTSTFTRTATRTVTGSASPTSSPTWSLTASSTVTETATRAATLTATATVTPTVTFTATRTITITGTRPYTRTATATATPSATPTATPSDTVTFTPSVTFTPTYTATPTGTPTGTLPPTRTATVTFSASTSATPTPTRTHTPTASATVTPTGTPPFTTTVTATNTITPLPEPKLELVKVADVDYAEKDAEVTYYIVYTNTGAADISNLVLSDTVPTVFSYVSSSGFEVGGVISWNIGNLGAGATGTATLVMFVPESAEGETVTNTAYATYASALDGLSRAPVDAVHDLLVLPEEQFFISRNIFNPKQGDKVNIEWKVAAQDKVFLGVYNTAGELVRLLRRGPVTNGFSMDKVEWDGKNDAGDLVASGVYVIYLHGSRAYYGKVVVIK